MFAKAAFSDKTYSFRELNEESIKKIKEMLSDALNVTIWDDNPERAAKISQHILDTQWSVDMSENDKAKAPAVWKIASSFVDQLNRDHFMNIIK